MNDGHMHYLSHELHWWYSALSPSSLLWHYHCEQLFYSNCCLGRSIVPIPNCTFLLNNALVVPYKTYFLFAQFTHVILVLLNLWRSFTMTMWMQSTWQATLSITAARNILRWTLTSLFMRVLLWGQVWVLHIPPTHRFANIVTKGLPIVHWL